MRGRGEGGGASKKKDGSTKQFVRKPKNTGALLRVKWTKRHICIS